MLKNLGRKIANNFGLKVLAAIFAVVLWVVVVNIDDPIKTQQYTTSVTPENTSYITSNGKYFEILDGNNTISFSVSAKRSNQEKLSNADFSATADMEKIEYVDRNGTYRVPVTISCQKFNSSQVTISSKQLYMEVEIEDAGSVQKRITASTKGTVLEGCALGDVEIVTSNLLKISGPSSVTSMIDSVEATINVEGMSSDVTDTVVPVLYDADKNVIDTTKLTMNLNTVTISAQILNTKDVALEFETSGDVADGYVMKGVSYEPQTVRIKGEATALNKINKITIPGDVLNLTDTTTNIETTVDISTYLPSNVSLVLTSDAKVAVKVAVEPIMKKSFEIPATALTVQNVKEGYKAKIGVDTVWVEVSGAKSDVEKLSEKDITGTLDATGMGRGDRQITAVFALDSALYQVTADVVVPVTIDSDKADAAQGTDNNSAGTGSTVDAAGDDSPKAEATEQPEEAKKSSTATGSKAATSGKKS